MVVVVLVLWSIRAFDSQLVGEVFHDTLAVLRRSRQRFLAYPNRLFCTRHRVSQGGIQMPVRHSGVV